MAKFTALFALLFVHVALVSATPVARGTQFITGPCNTDADCSSGCCGFNTGLCAGAVVALQRDGGCGHGDAQPNNNAAKALTGNDIAITSASTGSSSGSAASSVAADTTSAVASTSTSTAATSAGTQFITGPCDSDSDCANGCCGFNTGKCAGAVVALQRDGGCGHGDAQPNNNAAKALTGNDLPITSSSTGSSDTTSTAASSVAADTTTSAVAATSTSSAVSSAGTQFITGPCQSDSDCNSGCCGFNTGKCAGAVVALQRDGGCGHGDAQPNNNAAKALTGNDIAITSRQL